MQEPQVKRKRSNTKYIIILQHRIWMQKVLNEAQDEGLGDMLSRGIKIGMTADLALRLMQVGREWNTRFRIQIKNICQI